MKQILFFILAIVAIALATNIQSSNKAANTLTSKSSSTAEKHYSLGPKGSKNNKKSKKNKTKIIKIKRKKFKDPVKVLKEGWLKVSSPMFKHVGRFPTIELPNGKKIRMKVNRQFFRINQIFKVYPKGEGLPPNKKYFWFRLSGKFLYYSMTAKDINVLGGIALKNIYDSLKTGHVVKEKYCFLVKDRELKEWTLCAESNRQRVKWICQIKDILGHPLPKWCKNDGLLDAPATVITRKIKQPIILIPLASAKCNENWDYIGKGEHWNCECSEGK
jgi:PH domain